MYKIDKRSTCNKIGDFNMDGIVTNKHKQWLDA